MRRHALKNAAAEAAAVTADGGLDYLMFGTTFATASKPGREAAGVEALAAVCAATSLPVLALGGVTTERFGDVARSGADGFAAIGLFAGVVHPQAILRAARDAWTPGSSV